MDVTMTTIAVGSFAAMFIILMIGLKRSDLTMTQATLVFILFFVFAWSFGMAYHGGSTESWLNPTECCECTGEQ